MLEVEGFSKYYGPKPAVSDVSFSIGRGEIVALLGPNGAGKTTLLKAVTGYHYPTEGIIRVMDMDVTLHAKEIKKNIGYLPENTPLYDELTVKEYLSFIASARGFSGKDAPQAMEKVLSVCSIEDVIKEQIGRLSKGYRQRVGIAQAIIHSPGLVILDEPTNGLDPKQILEIRELLKQVGKDRTILISTHILAEAESVSSRVLILNKGKLIMDCPKSSLKKENKGSNSFICTFSNITEEELMAAVNELPGFISLKRYSAGKEYSLSFEISLMHPSSGADIFEWAKNRGFILSSLYQRESGLEEVFIALTSEGRNP